MKGVNNFLEKNNYYIVFKMCKKCKKAYSRTRQLADNNMLDDSHQELNAK